MRRQHPFTTLLPLIFAVVLTALSCTNNEMTSSITLRVPAPPASESQLLAEPGTENVLRVWLQQNDLFYALSDQIYLEAVLPVESSVENIRIENLPTGSGYLINISIGGFDDEGNFITLWFGSSERFTVVRNEVAEIGISALPAPLLDRIPGTAGMNFSHATAETDTGGALPVNTYYGTTMETAGNPKLYGGPYNAIVFKDVVNPDAFTAVNRLAIDYYVEGNSLMVSSNNGLYIFDEFGPAPQYYLKSGTGGKNVLSGGVLYDLSFLNFSIMENEMVFRIEGSYTFNPPADETILKGWPVNTDLIALTNQSCYLVSGAFADPATLSNPPLEPVILSDTLSILSAAGEPLDLLIKDFADSGSPAGSFSNAEMAVFATTRGLHYTTMDLASPDKGKWLPVEGLEEQHFSKVVATPAGDIKDAAGNPAGRRVIVIATDSDGTDHLLFFESADNFSTLSAISVTHTLLGYMAGVPAAVNEITGIRIVNAADEIEPGFLIATDNGIFRLYGF